MSHVVEEKVAVRSVPKGLVVLLVEVGVAEVESTEGKERHVSEVAEGVAVVLVVVCVDIVETE